jgi:hypothetical protein
MKVFGPKPWGNWTDRVMVPTPVGKPCFFCEEPIKADDLGVLMPHMEGGAYADLREIERPWHRDCLIHSIFARPEDERTTKRQSAAATRERLDKNGPAP